VRAPIVQVVFETDQDCHFSTGSFLARRALENKRIGLGYVVTVSAGCLAHQGHEVIGVGPIRTKIDLINSGQLPIVEADIGEILSASLRDKILDIRLSFRLWG
jgi:UDP-N-acetyl-D-mannosaminuronate dehydrogenase